MHHDDSIVILKGEEVRTVLENREQEVMDTVRATYKAHAQGQSSLPHSSFLRFPDRPSNRIIALPAYLGAEFEVAGIKWIASVPANTQRGMERASALIVLNSPETGRPWGILEASGISAARTAASAAVGAQVLSSEAKSPIGLIGCGRIAFEIVRYLRAALPEVTDMIAFDLDVARTEGFRGLVGESFPGLTVERAESIGEVLSQCPLVSFATTAGTPHVADLSSSPPGATVLHLSLRDLSAEAILASDNVADDVDHVCRERTSIHLAEQQCGHRRFVRTTLGEILLGDAPPRSSAEGVTVFSPFGLGVLDMSVARWVHKRAVEEGMGTVVESFLPPRLA